MAIIVGHDNIETPASEAPAAGNHPGPPETTMTYSFFFLDSSPNSAADQWGHDTLTAASASEALAAVRSRLAKAAESLSEADGYQVGQVLYGVVRDDNGDYVGEVTHEIEAL